MSKVQLLLSYTFVFLQKNVPSLYPHFPYCIILRSLSNFNFSRLEEIVAFTIFRVLEKALGALHILSRYILVICIFRDKILPTILITLHAT